jgi:hypothetical protein
MRIDVIETGLRCQHPFGDGLHVITLGDQPAEVIQMMLSQCGVADQLLKEYQLLRQLQQLSGSDKATSKCGVYPGRPPVGMKECYVIAKTTVKPEDEVEAVFTLLLVEAGHEKLAKTVAKQMCIALKNLSR